MFIEPFQEFSVHALHRSILPRHKRGEKKVLIDADISGAFK